MAGPKKEERRALLGSDFSSYDWSKVRFLGKNLDYATYIFGVDYFPIYYTQGDAMYYHHTVDKTSYVKPILRGVSFMAIDICPFGKFTDIDKRRLHDIKTFSDFQDRFRHTKKFYQYRFKSDGEEREVYFTKGAVFDSEGKILVMVTACQEDWNYNPKHTKLYLSTELETNPIYKTFYRKFQKEYVHPFMERGVDIVFAPSDKIYEELFVRHFEMKVESLSELKEVEDAVEVFYNSFDEEACIETEKQILSEKVHVVEIERVPKTEAGGGVDEQAYMPRGNGADLDLDSGQEIFTYSNSGSIGRARVSGSFNAVGTTTDVSTGYVTVAEERDTF